MMPVRSPPPASRDSAPQVPTRTELWLASCLCLAAFAFRVAWPSRLAVEHFDEGVYASNVWFGASQHYQYPNQFLYAPPLLPRLIEWLMILFGPSNAGAVAVSIVAGSLTVPLIWWVGRRWFGPAAGLTAAMLATFSDVHVLYSRAGLTDALLCFWLLAAVYFLREALWKGRPWPIIAAGLITGLAWWTKYNGWLPLAIGLAGSIAWAVLHRIGRPSNRQLATRWLLTALCAFLAWSPYLWDLAPQGGYAAVARNHRGYLVGWSGWYNSLAQQVDLQQELSGGLTIAGVVLLGVVASWGRFTGNAAGGWGVRAGILVVVAIWAVVAPGALVALAAVAGIATVIRTAMSHAHSETAGLERSLAGWLLAAWFLGLAISIPFYTPFPRLTLPWLMACWLGAGAGANWLACEIDRPAARRGIAMACAGLGCLGLLLAFGSWPLRAPGVPGWQASTSLADMAPRLAADACRDAGLDRQSSIDGLAVYVYGEPALLFQLRLAGLEHVVPVMHLAFARPNARPPQLPTYLVTGPHALRTTGFKTQFVEARQRLRLVKSYEYAPSNLVRLDDGTPAGAGNAAFDTSPVYRLELYRVE